MYMASDQLLEKPQLSARDQSINVAGGVAREVLI